jgi:hypothetical protein
VNTIADEIKKVTVYVSRRFTLNRPGKAPVAFQPGANTVDSDVAAHDFVRAHAVGPAESGADLSGALDAATKRADAAESALDAATKRADAAEGEAIKAHADLDAATAKIAELQAVIDATAAMGSAGGKK